VNQWLGPIISALALLVALVSLTRTSWRDNSKDTKADADRYANDQQTAQSRHAELSNRVSLLERMVDMIFKQVTINFAANLHKPHPNYAERDSLIEKYVREQITPDELERFRGVLELDRDNPDCDFRDQALAKSILEIMDMQYALRLSSPVLEVKALGLP
jgi:hypothetical protein